MTTAAMLDTYEDVQQLICKCCHDFRRKCGGEIKEHISRANELFVEYYLSGRFDKRKGDFSSIIWMVVWRGLMNDYARKVRTGKVVQTTSPDRMTAHQDLRRNRPVLEEILSGLSPDAREVVEIALHLPKTLTREAKRRGNEGRHKRKAIYEFLRGMDWPRPRIYAAFDEIREALET